MVERAAPVAAAATEAIRAGPGVTGQAEAPVQPVVAAVMGATAAREEPEGRPKGEVSMSPAGRRRSRVLPCRPTDDRRGGGAGGAPGTLHDHDLSGTAGPGGAGGAGDEDAPDGMVGLAGSNAAKGANGAVGVHGGNGALGATSQAD